MLSVGGGLLEINSRHLLEYDLYNIYIVEDDGYYKIEYAYDVIHRISQLQVTNPREIKTIKIYSDIPYPKKYEYRIHQALWKYHIRGEWFRCDLDIILNVCNSILNTDELYQERNKFKAMAHEDQLLAANTLSTLFAL
jgi:hypothetical protein